MPRNLPHVVLSTKQPQEPMCIKCGESAMSILLTAIRVCRSNETQNRHQFTCTSSKYSENVCADRYRHDWALRNSLAGNHRTDADYHKLPGVLVQSRPSSMVDQVHGMVAYMRGQNMCGWEYMWPFKQSLVEQYVNKGKGMTRV